MTERFAKPGQYKPPQPQIPGVPKQAPPPPFEPSRPAAGGESRLPGRMLVAAAFVVLLALGVFTWWKLSKASVSKGPVPAASAPAAPPPKAPAIIPLAPGPIATTEELSQPWSSKLFNYNNKLTEVVVPAMVVHLPNGEYWAFSLIEPYGDCRLDYTTDLGELSTHYGVAASHPMVTDHCNGSVFDLTKYGNGPGGLVRGEVIQGPALRPPVAIEIHVEGRKIIASAIE